ncbi:MAG: hypothetical protein QOH21_207, partial [Acidobacteriota bacterium]|nr:hypothetical protein [Acidobacteriota bacterium]
NFSRIMNVENISISALPGQEQKTISATFTAKTFVYTEPTESADTKKDSKKPGGA